MNTRQLSVFALASIFLLVLLVSANAPAAAAQTQPARPSPASGMLAPRASAMAIAAGENHTCALTTSGGVKCWGDNDYGELGDRTTTERYTPVDVSGLTSGVTAITAGEYHTCALTTSGGVKCWGYNNNGDLGDGTTTDRWTPVDVSGLTSGVIAISAGGGHTCALTTGGGIKCWGGNSSGELGDGTTVGRLIPVDVSGLTSGVKAIAAGYRHTCALTTAGGVKCWGNNSEGPGQLGDGTETDRYTSVDVSGLTSGVKAIAAGYFHTCALMLSGGAKCWGENISGELGDGQSWGWSLTPVDVSGLSSSVVQIAGGIVHTCAVTTNGGVKCWGDNGDGALGDGTTTNRPTPVDVSGLTSGVGAVSAGDGDTCALTAVGGVKCWGYNYYGQLGDGTTTDRYTPVDVVGFGANLSFTGSISSIYPASNSIASTIMQGGTAYRYFRLLDASSNPISNATVDLLVGSPTLSDASGYFTATIPTSVLGGLGSYQVSVQSVTYGGQTYPTNNQPSFGVQVTERRYSNAWSYGAERMASAGISTGLIALISAQTNGGLGLTLSESDPTRTDDDQVEMEESYSSEATSEVGLGIRQNISAAIINATLNANVTTEYQIRNFGDLKATFAHPYDPAQQEAQGIFLALSVLDSASNAGPLQPSIVRMLQAAQARLPYLNYISEQSAGTGAKVTPIQANLGANVSLAAKTPSSSQQKGRTLGFTLLDVGASRLVEAIVTAYGNEYSVGFVDELSVDMTALTPNIPLVKTTLIGLIGNSARRIHKAYFFDSVTNQLTRIELTLSSEGNPSAFTDMTKKQVAIKLILQGNGLTATLVEQVGQAKLVSDLNNLLNAVSQIPYEVTVEDGSNLSMVPELGIPGTAITIGLGLDVEALRNLVRERGVFLNGNSYVTELYQADVGTPGKNWTDLTTNALGGLWLLVQDVFNWISQQVTSGIGWAMNIVARTSTGVTSGGAQLNVPSGTQLQRLSAKGIRAPLTGPITVTVTSWVPASGTTNAPQRVKPSLRAASGEGFVVGGIYEFQPITMTLSPAASLVITYTDAAATGINKNQIAMFRWNETGNNWQSVAGQTPDPANNAATASITQLGTYALGYDAAPPQITIVTPANGSTITNTMPIISALVTDTGVGINPSSVQMRLNGQIVTATFITGTGQLLYMPPTALRSGSYAIAISAQDVTGNSASASATFNVQGDVLNYLPFIRK